MQRTQEAHHRRQLHRKLQAAADDGGDGDHDRQPRLADMSTLPEHRRDHGHVPDHRCGVGEEELAVAVQDAEAPCRNDQQRRSGKEDLHQADGEQTLFALEARAQ